MSPPTDAPSIFDAPTLNVPPPSARARRVAGARRPKRVTLQAAVQVPSKSSIPATALDRHPQLLGELAADNAQFLKSHGWRKLAETRRGRSALNAKVEALPHEAAGYLSYLQKYGAPVHSSAPPKTPEELQSAVDRGAHPSAMEYKEFLWEEAFEMCQRRHTMVLPFSAVKNLQGVQISPPGVVPQQGRRPRTICDLTFSGVNDTTIDLTHNDAMRFGRALRRILFQIHRADPRWGPVHISKVDISDGFYNVCVNAYGTKQFGIILPTPPGQEPLVLFFLGLPMGWVSSPPTFCALTETGADVANDKMAANWSPPPHRCDEAADTPTQSARPPSAPGRLPRIKHRARGPLGKTDVYVDDFILLAQGGRRRMKRLRRVLFHCIDMVFRAPDDQDDEWKKDPISLKKLLKGDGALETVKVILGWLVDTVAGTIELPPNRVERLKEILAAFPRSRKTCPKKDLHKLVGELRSMILALPGGVGCLSWLQETLKTANKRVYLNQHFHDAIEDFKWLAEDISSRPTRLAEVVPEAPTLVGTVDASGTGMGGVWLPDGEALYAAAVDPASLAPARDHRRGAPVAAEMAARDITVTSRSLLSDTEQAPRRRSLGEGREGAAEPPRLPTNEQTPRRRSLGEVPEEDVLGAPTGARLAGHCPVLWRHQFPEDIVASLVSYANPRGVINNSELELAGIIATRDVAARESDVFETTTATGTDNLAALSWSTKGAVSAKGPAAYLLRLQSSTSGCSIISRGVSTSLGRRIAWQMIARACGISLMRSLYLTSMSLIHSPSHGGFATSMPAQPRPCSPLCDASGSHCRKC